METFPSQEYIVNYILDKGIEPLWDEPESIREQYYILTHCDDEIQKITKYNVAPATPAPKPDKSKAMEKLNRELENFRQTRISEIDCNFRTEFKKKEQERLVERIRKIPPQIPRVVCVKIIKFLLQDYDPKTMRNIRLSCKDFSYVLDERWCRRLIDVKNKIRELKEILKWLEIYRDIPNTYILYEYPTKDEKMFLSKLKSISYNRYLEYKKIRSDIRYERVTVKQKPDLSSVRFMKGYNKYITHEISELEETIED